MAGGPIIGGFRLQKAHILDLFPTILHLLGLPVPDDVDGRVLTETFNPQFLKTSPVRRVPSYDFLSTGQGESAESSRHELNKELLEELRSLGYIQ
jgi:arylsulfatase A-like enzyme